MSPNVLYWAFLGSTGLYGCSTARGTTEVLGVVARDRQDPALWWPHVTIGDSLAGAALPGGPALMEEALKRVENHPAVTMWTKEISRPSDVPTLRIDLSLADGNRLRAHPGILVHLFQWMVRAEPADWQAALPGLPYSDLDDLASVARDLILMCEAERKVRQKQTIP